jgi:putative alpha-1,2-mannosidase
MISASQAASNLQSEIPSTLPLEGVVSRTGAEWKEKLNRIRIDFGDGKGFDHSKVIEGSEEWKELRVFYTALFHTMHYPYHVSEDGKYYSGYDDSVSRVL